MTNPNTPNARNLASLLMMRLKTPGSSMGVGSGVSSARTKASVAVGVWLGTGVRTCAGASGVAVG